MVWVASKFFLTDMSLLESEFSVDQEADCSEENLAELAQYQPANESELITQAHRSMVLLKGLRIAIKDCLNKTKTGAKVSVCSWVVVSTNIICS